MSEGNEESKYGRGAVPHRQQQQPYTNRQVLAVLFGWFMTAMSRCVWLFGRACDLVVYCVTYFWRYGFPTDIKGHRSRVLCRRRARRLPRSCLRNGHSAQPVESQQEYEPLSSMDKTMVWLWISLFTVLVGLIPYAMEKFKQEEWTRIGWAWHTTCNFVTGAFASSASDLVSSWVGLPVTTTIVLAFPAGLLQGAILRKIPSLSGFNYLTSIGNLASGSFAIKSDTREMARAVFTAIPSFLYAFGVMCGVHAHDIVFHMLCCERVPPVTGEIVPAFTSTTDPFGNLEHEDEPAVSHMVAPAPLEGHECEEESEGGTGGGGAVQFFVSAPPPSDSFSGSSSSHIRLPPAQAPAPSTPEASAVSAARFGTCVGPPRRRLRPRLTPEDREHLKNTMRLLAYKDDDDA